MQEGWKMNEGQGVQYSHMPRACCVPHSSAPPCEASPHGLELGSPVGGATWDSPCQLPPIGAGSHAGPWGRAGGGWGRAGGAAEGWCGASVPLRGTRCMGGLLLGPIDVRQNALDAGR